MGESARDIPKMNRNELSLSRRVDRDAAEAQIRETDEECAQVIMESR